MFARLSEIIHAWMGWCPNTNMAKKHLGTDDSTGHQTAGLLVRDDGLSGSDRPANPWDLQYEHTQPGYLLMGAVGGTILILLLMLVRFGMELVAIIVLAIMLFVLAIMSRLTVSVSNDTLRIRFGPIGLVRKEWPIQEIVSVTGVTNPWYYGFGIHWTPHGTLYNVSGRHAVEILLMSGKKVRIGTDEPEALVRAISHAIP
jgi:hypothetical protein